jgi:threonine aldolase
LIRTHTSTLEGGAPASLSSVLPRLLRGVRGIFTPKDVLRLWGSRIRFFATTIPAPVKLLCVENTHNLGGGLIWPLKAIEAVASAACTYGLAVHIDGARLWCIREDGTPGSALCRGV